MSPRLKGRRTIGAFVNTTPGGKLRLNFRWPLGQHGKLYRVTTDYRDILAEIAVNRLGNTDLPSLFPSYSPTFRGVTATC